MYTVMETEIDEELLTPGAIESIGSYGLMFVAVWRNSVGKLGYPNYDNMIKLNKNNKNALKMNVLIIWIMYFAQILF